MNALVNIATYTPVKEDAAVEQLFSSYTVILAALRARALGREQESKADVAQRELAARH